jgi:hypothetical protein
VLEGSNEEFIQDIDRDLNLLGLLNPELPTVPPPFREIPGHRVRFAGKPYLAFLTLGPDIIFGTANDVADRLRNEWIRLASFPFVQKSVARFLEDPELEAKAQLNIALRKERARARDSGLLDVRTIVVSRTVTRLTPWMPDGALLDRDGPAELEELAGRIGSDADGGERDLIFEAPPEERRTLQHLLAAPFRNTAPTGSQFAPPRLGAFYASTTIEGAAAEIGFFLAQFAGFLDERMSTSRTYLISEWDIAGEFVDLRHRPIDRTDWLESQNLGEKLRLAGKRGILYASPFHGSSESLCLFDPTTVKAGRLRGRLTASVDSNGRLGFSIQH